MKNYSVETENIHLCSLTHQIQDSEDFLEANLGNFGFEYNVKFHFILEHLGRKIPTVFKTRHFYMLVAMTLIFLLLPPHVQAICLDNIKSQSSSSASETNLSNIVKKEMTSGVHQSQKEIFDHLRKTQIAKRLGLSDWQKIEIFLLGTQSNGVSIPSSLLKERIKIIFLQVNREGIALSLKNMNLSSSTVQNNLYSTGYKSKFSIFAFLSAATHYSLSCLKIRGGASSHENRTNSQLPIRKNVSSYYPFVKYFFVLCFLLIISCVMIERNFRINELNHSLKFYLLLIDIYKKTLDQVITFEGIEDHETLVKALKKLIWHIHEIDVFRTKNEDELTLININEENN